MWERAEARAAELDTGVRAGLVDLAAADGAARRRLTAAEAAWDVTALPGSAGVALLTLDRQRL